MNAAALAMRFPFLPPQLKAKEIRYSVASATNIKAT
ncbi:hypothetical protein JOH51_006405 [Rhizobium leguminosarum]|nr:hypothetical protein [Rhizobium leguminosarum]